MLGEEPKIVMKSSQNFTSWRQEPIMSLTGLGKKPQKRITHQREENRRKRVSRMKEMWKCFQDDLFFRNKERPRHIQKQKRDQRRVHCSNRKALDTDPLDLTTEQFKELQQQNTSFTKRGLSFMIMWQAFIGVLTHVCDDICGEMFGEIATVI